MPRPIACRRLRRHVVFSASDGNRLLAGDTHTHTQHVCVRVCAQVCLLYVRKYLNSSSKRTALLYKHTHARSTPREHSDLCAPGVRNDTNTYNTYQIHRLYYAINAREDSAPSVAHVTHMNIFRVSSNKAFDMTFCQFELQVARHRGITPVFGLCYDIC